MSITSSPVAGTMDGRSIDTTHSMPKLWTNADGDRAPILGQYDLFHEESDFTLTGPPLPRWIVSVIVISAIIVSISTVTVAVFTVIVVAVATKVLMGGMALGIVLTASQSAAGPLNGPSMEPTKSMSKLWSNVDDNPTDESGETKRHFVNPTQCMSIGCDMDDEAVGIPDKVKRHFVNPTQSMSKLGCGMDDEPVETLNDVERRSTDLVKSMPKLSSEADDVPADGADKTKRRYKNPTQCMSKIGCGMDDDESVDTLDDVERRSTDSTKSMSKAWSNVDGNPSDDPINGINAIVDRSVHAVKPRLTTAIHDAYGQGDFVIRGSEDSAYHHTGLVMLYALFIFLIAVPFIYLLFFAKKHRMSKHADVLAEEEVGKGPAEKGEQSV